MNNNNKKKMYYVMYSASWCGNCKRMHPIMKKLVEENPDVFIKDKCVKIDVDKADDEDELLSKIDMIPTTIFFDENGNKVASLVGYKTYKELRDVIKE